MKSRLFTQLSAAGLLVVWLAAWAVAQPGDRPQRGPSEPGNIAERLKSMDRDRDGRITKQEASGPAARMFSRVDSNGDGVIDETEIKAVAARVGRGRPGTTDGGGAIAGVTAPDFILKSVDGKQEVKLSSFIDKTPVALIFGSYT